MQLMDTKETYPFEVDMGVGKDKNPVFEMKKLTSHETDELDDNSTLTVSDPDNPDKPNEIKFLQGTIKRMKIEFAVIGFVKNIDGKDGQPAKFNKETLALLLPSVRDKLVKHIDEKNELNPDRKKEAEKTKK